MLDFLWNLFGQEQGPRMPDEHPDTPTWKSQQLLCEYLRNISLQTSGFYKNGLIWVADSQKAKECFKIYILTDAPDTPEHGEEIWEEIKGHILVIPREGRM